VLLGSRNAHATHRSDAVKSSGDAKRSCGDCNSCTDDNSRSCYIELHELKKSKKGLWLTYVAPDGCIVDSAFVPHHRVYELGETGHTCPGHVEARPRVPGWKK
jgi:hypothetical protein